MRPAQHARGERYRLRLAILGAWVLSFAAVPSCASALAVGRGGPVYELRVATVNGTPTANKGPSAHPACVVQVGNRVATVWLANPSHADHESPVVLEADAEALKDGILVERSWGEAIVHQVTEAELAAGAAVVYVPSVTRPTTVELRFDRVSRISSSDRNNNLAKHRAGLQQPVSSSDLH